VRNSILTRMIFTAWVSVCFAAAAPAQHGGGGGGHSSGSSGGGHVSTGGHSSGSGGGGHVSTGGSSGGGHSSTNGGHAGGVSTYGGGTGGPTTPAPAAPAPHAVWSGSYRYAPPPTGANSRAAMVGASGWQEPPANPGHARVSWHGISSTHPVSPAALRHVTFARVAPAQRFVNDGMRSRHHHRHGGGDGDFDDDDGFFGGFGFGFFGGGSTCFFSGISSTCFFNGFFPPLFISPFFSPFFGPWGIAGYAEPWGYGPVYSPGYDATAQAASSDEYVTGYAPVPPPEAPAGMAEEAAPLTLIFLTDGTNFAVTDYWLEGRKLHYVTSYGGENSVALEKFDLQKTVDENYKLGILFSLRPAPAAAPDSAEPPTVTPPPTPPPAAPQPPAPPAS
jgi:hypothetical protein